MPDGGTTFRSGESPSTFERQPLRDRSPSGRGVLASLRSLEYRARQERPADARSMRESLSTVSVVLPVFNEAALVGMFHVRLRTVMDAWARETAAGRRTWEAVYVNDGSTDGSREILADLCRGDERVTVVNLRRNFGQTAALAAGMDHASGDVIITMDSDLQHLPEEIPLLLEKIAQGHDVVLSYRRHRRDHLLFRRLPSLCANRLMRRLSGVTVRDFGSTFKAFRREVVGEFEMFGDVHRFLPVLGAMAGCDMAEVPITNAPRAAGTSHYGLGRTFGVLVDIVTLGFFSSYLTRPGRPWGYLALLTGGIGLAIQATLLALYVGGVIPTPLDRPGWLMLSVLMECIGLQCLGFSAISELLGRTYFASRRKPIYSIRSVLSGRRPTRAAPRPAMTVKRPARLHADQHGDGGIVTLDGDFPDDEPGDPDPAIFKAAKVPSA